MTEKNHLEKIDYILLLILFTISLFLLKDLYRPGIYTSHDGPNQIVRLYHFNQALDDGQFPPRWSAGLINGFGYPLFLFSYHLPWWIAQLPRFFGADIFISIKFVFVVTYVFSAIAMYFFIKNMWGSVAAFTAAFVYLVTPFRFVDIFVRAALGESVSFAFIPLIFWALYRLRYGSRFSSLLIGIIGLTGLLLTHVMIFSLLIVPLVLWFLHNLRYTFNRMKYIKNVLGMITGAVGLSAYYIVPAIFYRPITVFTEKFQTAYTYHFTNLQKLFYSPWGYNGTELPDEMSRQVGLTQWFVLLLSFALINWYIFRVRKTKKEKEKVSLGIILFFCFLFAVFMMLPVSTYVWRIIQSLALVEFPWRYLAVTTFLGSVLAGFVISFIKKKTLKFIIIIAILALATYNNRNYLRINQIDNTPVTQRVNSELTTSLLDEYLPKWIDATDLKQKKFFLQSEAQIKEIGQLSNEIRFTYSSSNDTTIIVSHMYFPGWHAYTDNKETELLKTDSGSMLIYALKGNHDVLLTFKETLPMKTGNAITLFTAGILIFLAFVFRKQKLNKTFAQKRKQKN